VESGRSQTIHWLHASEVAFWDNPSTLMTGLRQAIPNTPTSAIFLESTANGVGNYFHTTWSEAVSGESEFTPFFFPWWQHYEYTADWLRLPTNVPFRADSEERLLRVLLRTHGLTDTDIKSRLIWRRWAIRNLAEGDLLRFQQEYPACVVGETRVGTDMGIVPIAEITPGTVTGLGVVVGRREQRVSPTYRLTTKLGYSFTGTHDHPVFTSAGVLVPLVACEGQTVKLIAPRFAAGPYRYSWSRLGIEHSVVVDEDWGRFLGLFMGNGSLSGVGTLSIVCNAKDPDLVAEVQRLVLSLFGVEAQCRAVGSKKGGTEVRVQRRAFVELFDDLKLLQRNGSGRITRRVHVPDAIWRSPRPVVAAFLSGLLEADGFNAYASPRVMFFSKYKKFLADVQLLLLGFGITSRAATVMKRSNGYEYPGHELSLRVNEALLFNERIGFISNRKRSMVAYAPSTAGRRARPITLTDTVTSVEPAGVSSTYDLTVDTGAAFDANGVLTHNTADEAFVATGRNVFPHASLAAVFVPMRGTRGFLTLMDGAGRWTESSEGNWALYKRPAADKDYGRYLVAGDPTHTTRGDYACIQVINRRTLEQVATARIRTDPITFASDLFATARYYNDALIVTETTGPGYSTIGALIAMGYPHLYRAHWADKTQGAMADSWGFSTNVQRKHWAIGALLKHIVDGAITVHDRQTYSELINYVTLDNGGYGAPAGQNDDTVMALAIGVLANMTEPPLPPEGAQIPEGAARFAETFRGPDAPFNIEELLEAT
jgi:intein/homing endonuclease